MKSYKYEIINTISCLLFTFYLIIIVFKFYFRGKFAAVKRCKNSLTGEEFAAKVIRKRRRGDGLTPESLHEAATLDLCRSCPHIVRLEQVYDTPGETILILQL